MKSVHFGDRPSTLPHEDRTQGKVVERKGGKGNSRGRGGTEKRRKGWIDGGKGDSTGRREDGEGCRERGSPVTVAGTGRLQSSLSYTQPPRGSDTLAGCHSPPTGSPTVDQQVCSFL